MSIIFQEVGRSSYIASRNPKSFLQSIQLHISDLSPQPIAMPSLLANNTSRGYHNIIAKTVYKYDWQETPRPVIIIYFTVMYTSVWHNRALYYIRSQWELRISVIYLYFFTIKLVNYFNTFKNLQLWVPRSLKTNWIYILLTGTDTGLVLWKYSCFGSVSWW